MSSPLSYGLARPLAADTPTAAPRTTLLALPPGQAQWLHLPAGSSLYCSAGAVCISSPWQCAQALVAEQAPHCTGAHAGWYWLEAQGPHGAQVHVSHQAYAGWQSAWQAVARWIGWQA